MPCPPSLIPPFDSPVEEPLTMKSFFALVLFCTLIIPAFSSDRLNESGNAFLHACSVVDQTDSEKDNSEVHMGFVCGAYVRGFVEGVDYG
jgi:hypothetical protein